MFNYAQLDDEYIVTGVSSLSGEPEGGSSLIKIDKYDTTLLGKKYNRDTQQFEEVADATN